MSRKVRILLSLLCFVAAFGCAVAYGDGIRKEEQHLRGQTLARFGGDVVQLVVTTHDLEPGTTVAPTDVALVDWIAELAPTSAFTSIDEVVGKSITAGAAKNTLLSSFNFEDEADFLEVPEGMVAISVPLSERLMLPTELKPRTSVCAWVTGKQGSTLLSAHVVVLKIPESNTKGSSSRQQKTLTLAVEPAQVGKLLDASSASQLRLVVPAQDVIDVGGVAADKNAEVAGSNVDAIATAEPATDAATNAVANAVTEAANDAVTEAAPDAATEAASTTPESATPKDVDSADGANNTQGAQRAHHAHKLRGDDTHAYPLVYMR